MKAKIAVLCAILPLAATAGPVYFTGTTCGNNAVTELQAGAISLPGGDVAVTVPGGYVGVQPEAGLDVAIVLCDDVSPLSRCTNIVDAAGPGGFETTGPLLAGTVVRVDSAVPLGTNCGNVTVFDMSLD